jgi:hypothetical protein
MFVSLLSSSLFDIAIVCLGSQHMTKNTADGSIGEYKHLNQVHHSITVLILALISVRAGI